MQEKTNLLVPLLFSAAAIPYTLLGLQAWRKRHAAAAASFAWAMFGMSIWTLGYSLELYLPGLSQKLFVFEMEYIGIALVPIMLFFFSLEYIGKGYLLTAKNRAYLLIPPILTLIAIWTNEHHGLIWANASITSLQGLSVLSMEFRPFFWVNAVYLYMLVLIGVILLVMEMIQRPGIYRVQISLVIASIIAPIFGNLIYTATPLSAHNLNFAPLLFFPAALGLSWAMLRYQLLEFLPLEHASVLQNMTDGVVVINPRNNILYLNPIAEEIFNRKESEAVGQPLDRVLGEYSVPLSTHLNGQSQHVEIKIGSGLYSKFFEVEVSNLKFGDAEHAVHNPNRMIILHDITHRKEVEEAISKREAIMSAISFGAGQFLLESTWERNVPAVLKKVGQAIHLSRVQVYVNYLDASQAVHTSLCYEWAGDGIEAQLRNPDMRHISLRNMGLSRWETILSQNMHIQGLAREMPDAERELLAKKGCLSMAVMPIFVEKQWWGMIMFEDCSRERIWDSVELEALHTMASIFGSAESRAKAEQKLYRKQKSLTLLHNIVTQALRTHELTEMIQELADSLTNIINADACFIALWNDELQQVISLAASSNYRKKHPKDQSLFGKKDPTHSALKLRRTLIIEDTSNSPYLDAETARLFDAHSQIVLPLIAGSKKIGSAILTFETTHRFTSDEIDLCEHAASLIALAIEKVSAVQEAQRKVELSETIRKAGTVVAEALDTEVTVKRILEQLKQVVPYDSASIQILKDNELEIIGGSGWKNSSDVIGMTFPIPGDNPNTIVIATGAPYILAEADQLYPAFNNPPNSHIRSWLGVPLIHQGKIIGLLSIDASEPNSFSREDGETALRFADQVVVALENARIFEEAQAQAVVDPLTNLYNRRGLFQYGQMEFNKSVSAGKKFSVIMIDVDHFKTINDTYGHHVGDIVLQELAKQCKKCVREIDLVGRYGGEEITILLPETDLKASLIVAERLRKSIEDSAIVIDKDTSLHITASLGVACLNKHTSSLSILINRADQAMYNSKHRGRNQVSFAA